MMSKLFCRAFFLGEFIFAVSFFHQPICALAAGNTGGTSTNSDAGAEQNATPEKNEKPKWTDILTAWATVLAAAAACAGVISIILLFRQTKLLAQQTTFVAEQTKLLTDQATLLHEQAVLVKKQMSDDHDRSRHELAIALIRFWTESLTLETSSACQLVRSLESRRVRLIYERKALWIEEDLKPYLEACTGKRFKVKDGKIEISAKRSAMIRHWAITYLNNLETILGAWRHHVADQKIIEEQFAWVVHDDGSFALETLREIAGGRNSLPALAEFTQRLRDKQAVAQSPYQDLGKPQ